MVNLFHSFSRVQQQKVLVIGDLMLDAYTIGRARRISPEAPVPVVHVEREESRAGGAGNVAINLVALGGEVVMVGRVGPDDHGEELTKTLEESGVIPSGLFCQSCYRTPVKNRVIADHQQMVRIDHEVIMPLPEQLEQEVIDALPNLMEKVSVVAISDYGKGFVTPTLLRAVFDFCREKGIPVVTDPKGVDFTKYRGTTVIKPNLSEVYGATNLPLEVPLETAAKRLLDETEAEVLMVTKSEEGITLFHREGKEEHFPVKVREVKDVTGAGDTVLAVLTMSLANGLPIDEATRLSNVAAGLAVEKLGCAQISLPDLARRLLRDDANNKVFDEEHLFALQEALRGRRFALLSISEQEGLTPALFNAIRQLSQRENWDLLVYVEELEPSEAFVGVLATLHDVDYIMVNGNSLEHLRQLIPPEEVYVIEDGILACK